MKVELIDSTNTDFYEQLIIIAHSTRKSEPQKEWTNKTKSIDDLCRDLLRWNHTGVFEHLKFTFQVSEVSRCLTHQLVRHRIASYLQMSNRHAIPDIDDFVVPESFGDKTEEYKNAMKAVYNLYLNFVKRGVPIEDARYLLPPGFFTHITFTMDGRELMHFFDLRCKKDAQWEIRQMANEMLTLCQEKFPLLFNDTYRC